MTQMIQTAWQNQSPWLVVLRPLSYLYYFAFKLNQTLYQMGFKTSYQAPVPVMVIGNITVGGSGKTPLLIEIVRYLQQHHVKVGVISRGYGGTGIFPALVDASSIAKEVGDEPCLIVQATHVPMAVGANRQQAIELLLQHHDDLQLIISDDGLQHWALKRDIEWVVYDSVRGLGNEKLLPEGFLREPKSRLEKSTVIEHNQQATHQLQMYLSEGQPYLLNQQKHYHFDITQSFHVIVGIGYPQRFYQTLSHLGIKHLIKHEFPDHYAYTIQDLCFNDQFDIITTEKDAVKLKQLIEQSDQLKNHKIWVVPVRAILTPACYQTLKQQLACYNIKIDK